MLVIAFPDWALHSGQSSLQGSPVTMTAVDEETPTGNLPRWPTAAGAKITMLTRTCSGSSVTAKSKTRSATTGSVSVTHVRDVSPEEMQQAAQKACS